MAVILIFQLAYLPRSNVNLKKLRQRQSPKIAAKLPRKANVLLPRKTARGTVTVSRLYSITVSCIQKNTNCVAVLGDGAVGGVSNKLYHRRLHGKIRRQRKRLAGMPFGGVDTRPTVQQKIIESSTSQVTPMNMPEVKVAQSAWTGAHTRSDTSSSPATLSLEDALSINYRLKLIRWDGL